MINMMMTTNNDNELGGAAYVDDMTDDGAYK